MPLFATLTTEQICSEIDAVGRHVILAAPGIGMPVAEALLRASQRLSKGAVQVVLDVSPSVARLGYGEYAAIEKLVAVGIPVHQHVGLRIGVLICDDAGWSFASSPSLVEADPVGDGDAFNAIELTAAQVMVLRGELPTITREVKHEPVPEYTVVGTELVNDATMSRVKRALDIVPPVQFDLARQTQVYAALIQFVELSFEGFNIQSRRVQLPRSLPLIASKNKAIKDRLTTSLKVLDQIEKPEALSKISAQLEELRQAYLIPVGHAGRIMLKSKRIEFENELKVIETALADCKTTLEDDLGKALKGVVDAVVPDLARAVMADPPPRFRGLFSNSEESAIEFVREELARFFPTATELVAGMKIHIFYKDVTYETLKAKDFSERVMKLIPASVVKEGSLVLEKVAVESGKAAS